jgi:hypothetical protein
MYEKPLQINQTNTDMTFILLSDSYEKIRLDFQNKISIAKTSKNI